MRALKLLFLTLAAALALTACVDADLDAVDQALATEEDDDQVEPAIPPPPPPRHQPHGQPPSPGQPKIPLFGCNDCHDRWSSPWPPPPVPPGTPPPLPDQNRCTQCHILPPPWQPPPPPPDVLGTEARAE